MSNAKKKPPIRPCRISITMTGLQAQELTELIAKLQASKEHGHRKWTPAEAAREGLSMFMQEMA